MRQSSQLSLQLQVFEAVYSNGRGGHRFWLFCFNWFATAISTFAFMAFLAYLTFITQSPTYFVSLLGCCLSLLFLSKANMTEFWGKISSWRPAQAREA